MITKEDAKQAAEKGLIEALRCSIQHHKDGRDMTSLELQNARVRNVREDRRFSIGGDHCALCYHFGGNEHVAPPFCNVCPLGPKICCKEHDNLGNMVDNFDKDPSSANHAAFVEAEKVMIERLEKELERVVIEERAKSRAEEEKKNHRCYNCKHELRHPCYNCCDWSHWEPKEKKPELRHGDYCQPPNREYTYIALNSTRKTDEFEIWGIRSTIKEFFVNGRVKKTSIYYTPTGKTIFDDLKNRKDDKFEEKNGPRIKVNVELSSLGSLIMKQGSHYITISQHYIGGFMQKLQDLVKC